MKTKKSFVLLLAACMVAITVNAQTAEEIVKKHIDAVGGKVVIDQLKTAYIENSVEVMGNQSPSKVYIVNGKGYKMVAEVMGSQMVTCYTDTFGWTINPMAGMNEPTKLPMDQYKLGHDQIYIGDPLIDYSKKGNKLEYLGEEVIGGLNAYKLKLVNALGAESIIYIDPKTYYIVQTVVKMQMMNQDMIMTNTMSDFRKTDVGYVMPFVSESNFSDQFYITSKISKIEINKEIDPSVFSMSKVN